MALIQRRARENTPTASDGIKEKKTGESRQRAELKRLRKNTARQQRGQGGKGVSQPAPKNTVEYLGYTAMYEDGVCLVRPGLYSASMQVSDINYQAARLDDKKELSALYGKLLNSVDTTVHVQLTILNRSLNKERFRETMLLPAGEETSPDKRFRDEMNRVLEEKALEGQNSIIREKYFTVATQAQDYLSAKAALSRIETDFTGQLKSLGCNVMNQSGIQRLELIHHYTRPDQPFRFRYDDLLDSGLTTKHAVAPTSLDFSSHQLFQVGEKYNQVLILRDLPSRLTDDLITKITDLPFEMTITVHIDRVPQDKALETIRSKIAFMEGEQSGQQSKAYQKGYDPRLAIPREQQRDLNRAIKLLYEIEENDQCLYKMTFLIHTSADSMEELNDRVLQICGVCAQKSCTPEPLKDRQREAFNATLPLGYNSVDIRRTMHTKSLSLFIPFTTQELYQLGGINYGLNAISHNLLFFSRPSLEAPNGWILGKSGSGKSMAAKLEMINVLLHDPNSEVVVIDPEQEYAAVCDAFRGTYIHISAGSKDHLNPMDITENYSDEDDPLLLKTEFVLSMIETICGEVTAGMKSVVSRACMLSYRPFFSNPKKHAPPTLKDFYEILKMQPEQEAKDAALALEIYIDGALSAFSHRTNVAADSRFVVYDVKDLGKQLRTLGMLIVLDQIWNRITRNRAEGIRTWIYIDEIQLLLSNRYCSEYFFELWSRARKWSAIPTGVTQNVETLLLSDTARRMLSNSDFVVLLNQAQPDRVELAGLLQISNRQLSYITNAEPGHGLLIAGKAVVPFNNAFPTDTEIYRLITTKPGEMLGVVKKGRGQDGKEGMTDETDPAEEPGGAVQAG